MSWTNVVSIAFENVVPSSWFNGVRGNLQELDPSGAEAGQVPKVNATLDGYEMGFAGMKRAAPGSQGEYHIPTVGALPNAGALGNVVSSGAAAQTYGAWVEFVAAASQDMTVVGVIVGSIGLTGTADYAACQIGIGVAGSEAVRGAAFLSNTSGSATTGTNRLLFSRAIAVTTGDRIAVRSADSSSSSNGHRVTLIVIDADDEEDY